MFADLVGVNREAVVHRHKLAVFLEEIYQTLCREILGAAGVETLFRAELLDDSLQKALFCLAVPLHHGKYFVSVCHCIGYSLKLRFGEMLLGEFHVLY